MKIKRRHFVAGCAAGLAGSLSAQGRSLRPLPSRKAQPTYGTARNLIFILLDGAPSHVDTFDVKRNAFSPNYLGIEKIKGSFDWPSGIFPRLSEMTDRFTVIRSMSAVEAVHSRAVYHLLTAHRQNSALAAEIPHFASMISFKLADQRQAGDSLPTAMMIGRDPAKNGFLPLDHQGLRLSRQAGIPNLAHCCGDTDDRFGLWQRLTDLSGSGRGIKREGHKLFQQKARVMMTDPDLQDLVNAEELENPSEMQLFRRQCEAAVRVIAANKGTRFFQLELGNWDHHVRIYDRGGGSLFNLSRALDDGFAYLIETLDALPGVDGGTLLDETMIVALGEFGRTVGGLNTSAGRDHYPFVVPALVAGGGVRPGRVIGATDSTGGNIRDPGWSVSRYMTIHDLTAAMFSAMGIDWTQRFEDTPSGRVFEMVDTTLFGPVFAIDELFV